MIQQLIYIFLFCLSACSLIGQDTIPSKEEVMETIMDVNISEEEAIEILAKYYPELLNPVVDAKKDFEKAQSVDNSADAGSYYQNLGRKALDQKNFDEAIIYFQKAIVKKKAAEGDNDKHPEISTSYQGLGKAYEGKADIESALQSYQRGLISNSSDFYDEDLLKNPESTQLIANSLAIPLFEAKGNLLLQSENDERRLLAALGAYERGIEILELVCKKFNFESTQLQLSEQVMLLSEKAILAALKLFKTTRDKKYKNRVFKIAEKGKAMILASTLLESEARQKSNAPSALLLKEQQLKTKIAQLNQIIRKRKSQDKGIKKAEKQLFAVSQTLFFLQDSIKTLYPEAEYLKFISSSPAIDSLQRTLAYRDAAIVEYFFGHKNAYVMTLTADNFYINKIESVDQLLKAIFELRQDIQQQSFKTDATDAFNTFTSKSKIIYGIALEKALEPIAPTVQELIIIPDGALWLVPFEILLYDQVKNQALDFSPDNLPYLLNKYNITYTYASHLMNRNNRNELQTPSIPFAGFAPDFQNQNLAVRSCFNDNIDLPNLAFNQNELQEVSVFFDGKANYGSQASKQNFRNQFSQAEIIHLSTHACLSKDDPMQSRIFFSNQDYMTIADFYGMKTPAKMAVLSACQTGLGQVYNGEGVISLARAFRKAGCPSVTMSLWSVADEATANIMKNYYEKLDEGINKGEALRQAKIDYINTQPKAKQHPYYWAAFVHLGDTSPIHESSQNRMFFWALLIGGILIMSLFLNKRRPKSRR